MHELELSNKQIVDMVVATAKNASSSLGLLHLKVVKSDSYGDHKHRTWVFTSPGGEMVGTIERYWGGLKMISSVFGGTPRTKFFTEDGRPTTNKGLKAQQ